MKKKFQRRHSRIYELLLLNSFFQFAIGFIVIVVLPNHLVWNETWFYWPIQGFRLNTLLTNFFAYSVSFYILQQFKRFPGTQSLKFIFPTISVCWLVVFSFLLMIREEEYSRPVLMVSFLLSLLWSFLGVFIRQSFLKPKFALVPFGRALDLVDTSNAVVTVLKETDISKRRYDYVVADLHADEMPREWRVFIARCTLAGIPVYNTQHVIEILTGRVLIERLSENSFGSLQPPVLYGFFKRLIDLVVAVLFLPLFFIVLIIVAFLIKLDSKGSVFYLQRRMGYRGKIFTMYKFRSMRNDMEGERFTCSKIDPRITRVGKIIRKYRIDELPQVFNVLKGDMSFIGPRPESLELSLWYEKDIPFFSYRHIVRPGLSGWAQVNQGYAAEIDDMKLKLQYDFYYIKNISLLLDALVFFKTIRVVLTGFGSR